MRGIRAKIPAVLTLAICAVMLSCHSSQPSQTASSPAAGSDSLTTTKSFAPGRHIDLNINVADVNIQPASDDHQLRLIIRPRHPVSPRRMHSWIDEFDVNSHPATIHLQLPKLASAQVTLYVPSSTSLTVRLGIGNLTIDRISGDKDVDMNVGNITLAGLHRADYGVAAIRTDVGNIDDHVFAGRTRGMIGKSKNVTGPGKFRLRAHVGTGNITLRSGASGETD